MTCSRIRSHYIYNAWNQDQLSLRKCSRPARLCIAMIAKWYGSYTLQTVLEASRVPFRPRLPRAPSPPHHSKLVIHRSSPRFILTLSMRMPTKHLNGSRVLEEMIMHREKQRILWAYAFYAQPPIFTLPLAVSHRAVSFEVNSHAGFLSPPPTSHHSRSSSVGN